VLCIERNSAAFMLKAAYWVLLIVLAHNCRDSERTSNNRSSKVIEEKQYVSFPYYVWFSFLWEKNCPKRKVVSL